jgi:hypothetical protein
MRLEKLSNPFWPAMLAIIFSTIGWLGSPNRPVMYGDAIPGLKIVEAFFGLPGVFVAVIAAMLFSPQGFHWWGPIRMGHLPR